MQLVAELPGVNHVQVVVGLDGRDQVMHELVVRTAPGCRIERQQKLDVIVHPARTGPVLAGDRLVVVDERDDQALVVRAQQGRDLGDSRTYTRTVPFANAAAVGGEHADDAAAQPARIAEVLDDVAGRGWKACVHLEQQEAAVEGVGGGDARGGDGRLVVLAALIAVVVLLLVAALAVLVALVRTGGLVGPVELVGP